MECNIIWEVIKLNYKIIKMHIMQHDLKCFFFFRFKVCWNLTFKFNILTFHFNYSIFLSKINQSKYQSSVEYNIMNIYKTIYAWAVSFLFIIMTYQVDRLFLSSLSYITFSSLNFFPNNRFKFTFDVKISEFERAVMTTKQVAQ